MTTANQTIEQPAPQRSAPSQLSKGEVINELSACLALVRPVSMTEDMATEWLAVAAGEVARMRPAAFRLGCAEARRECTHHGQIVPTILNGKEAQSWKAMGSSIFLPAPRADAVRLSDNSEAQKLIAKAAQGCRV